VACSHRRISPRGWLGGGGRGGVGSGGAACGVPFGREKGRGIVEDGG
jgi:hypothetical protein